MAGILSVLLIIIPWSGSIVIWRIGNSRPQWLHRFAVIFSFIAGIFSLVLLGFTGNTVAFRVPFGAMLGEFTLVPDGLGASLAAVACVVGSLAVLFSVDYMRTEMQLSRYYAFVLLFIGAMSGLVLSGNLVFIFFFWEITALCSYVLISFYNDDPRAVAGGVKALIITQVGGVGLLVGTLVCYSSMGSLQVSDLMARASGLPPAVLSLIAFGFLFAAMAKSAQFPFHTWLPDAMEAPTPVSALIHAATMVNAGVYLLARFYPTFENVAGWTFSVILVGVISALVAGLMALVAMDLKRVLAYSTVSQLGYMVYAVGVGGVFASQFHLLSHAVFKALLFLSAGAVIHSVGTRDMGKMGALGEKMPFIRNVFVIGAIALAGIPPMNGFWSKESILEAGLKHGPFWAFLGMLVGVGLTGFYTIRMTWLVFFGTARENLHIHASGNAVKISTGVLAVGAVFIWLVVQPFSSLLKNTLPFHEIESVSILGLMNELFLAPVTWVAISVMFVGVLFWYLLEKKWQPKVGMEWFDALVESGFGFDWFNAQMVAMVNNFASQLQRFQTGELNWNILGIVGALLLVLASLVWGM